MSKINRKELFDANITEPEELGEILAKIFRPELESNSMFNLIDLQNSDEAPPIFIYSEHRDKNNWLSTFSYYGGDGQGAIHGLGTRQILELNAQFVGPNERGKIMNAFCQIEFCIDVLTCLSQGAFDSQRDHWPKLKPLFRNEGEKLSTIEKRLNVLLKEEKIIESTKSAIIKARNIRDTLAHQFLPQKGLGLSMKDVKRYSSITEAIELIFNDAWFKLLSDFVPQEVKIAHWLEKRVA